MRWWVTSLVVLCALAGCSGGSDSAPDPTPTPKPSVTSAAVTASGTPTPAVTAATGEPAPEALSKFRCDLAKKDLWEATGFLANDGKKAATYQVSVYVGPIDGTSHQLRTQQVANVAAGGSVQFEITKIPADGEECHVQVLRTG